MNLDEEDTVIQSAGTYVGIFDFGPQLWLLGAQRFLCNHAVA